MHPPCPRHRKNTFSSTASVLRTTFRSTVCRAAVGIPAWFANCQADPTGLGPYQFSMDLRCKWSDWPMLQQPKRHGREGMRLLHPFGERLGLEGAVSHHITSHQPDCCASPYSEPRVDWPPCQQACYDGPSFFQDSNITKTPLSVSFSPPLLLSVLHTPSPLP